MLQTKGKAHTSLSGFREIEQIYPDQAITDRFRVVRKLDSQEDEAGNCYDWYEIDRHYQVVDRTRPVKEQVESLGNTAGIAFVVMAEAGQIDDVTAGEHAEVFAAWTYPVAYTEGQIRRDPADGMLYRVNQGQGHTSQADWAPHKTPAMWTRIADPAEEWPAWSQPLGAHDAYGDGDKVSHNGRHWVSSCDNNVWEPGVYGWNEAQGE